MRSVVAVSALLLAAGCASGSAAPKAPPEVNLPAEVVVLGDSTGNDINDWPAVWCAGMVRRDCRLRQWDFEDQAFAPDWSHFGGEGRRVRIWNLSYPGARADYPLQEGRLATVRTSDPGVVILNFGHNQTPEDVVPALSHLADAVRERWPDAQIVVTLQNPVTTPAADDQKERIAKLRAWATDEGLPVVDAWSALEDAGNLPAHLLDDGTHPNDRGTRVWVGAVRELFR